VKIDAFKCDNKQCNKIVDAEHIKTIIIGTVSYDLCNNCIDELNKIIQQGFEVSEPTINKVKQPKKSAQEYDTDKINKYGIDKLQQAFDNGASMSTMANTLCVSYQALKQFTVNNNMRYTPKKGPRKKEKETKQDTGTSI
jgi:hypothetical protein